jgi:hypothetical protein
MFVTIEIGPRNDSADPWGKYHPLPHVGAHLLLRPSLSGTVVAVRFLLSPKRI